MDYRRIMRTEKANGPKFVINRHMFPVLLIRLITKCRDTTCIYISCETNLCDWVTEVNLV